MKESKAKKVKFKKGESRVYSIDGTLVTVYGIEGNMLKVKNDKGKYEQVSLFSFARRSGIIPKVKRWK